MRRSAIFYNIMLYLYVNDSLQIVIESLRVNAKSNPESEGSAFS